jgi:hypothetical protein
MKTSAASTERNDQPRLTAPAAAQARADSGFADGRQDAAALQRMRTDAEASPRSRHLAIMQMMMSHSTAAVQRQERRGAQQPLVQVKPAMQMTPGMQGQVVVQRVTAQILPDATDGKIGGVAIIGRPPHTFPGSMGDHTTAFTLIASGLENRLSGKTIMEASVILAMLIDDLRRLPGMKLAQNLPKPHAEALTQALEGANRYLKEFRKFRKQKQKNLIGHFTTPVDQPEDYEFSAGLVSHMQKWIACYLEARELVPLSTINTKALNATLAGKGKGESPNSLIAAENKDGVYDLQTINAAVGLFDARSAAVVCMLNDQSMLNAIAPGMKTDILPDDRRDMLIAQHIATLHSLYPKTMAKIKERDDTTPLTQNLTNNVNEKIRETQSVQNEKKTPQKRGARTQKEGKRYLASSLTLNEYEIITDVKIGGRGTSPYSTTMGAHTTAWTVLTDVVWSELVGLNLLDAAEKLIQLTDQAVLDLNHMSALFQADDKQIYRLEVALINTDASLRKLDQLKEMKEIAAEENTIADIDVTDDTDTAPVDTADGMMEETTFYSPWEQMLILQEAINHLLDLQNLSPGASLYVGNTNGAREGSHRGKLITFCNQRQQNNITISKDDIKIGIMGLLDMKGLDQHLDTTEENLLGTDYSNSSYYKRRGVSAPREKDSDNAILFLLNHHFSMISKAYPGALEYAELANLSKQDQYRLSMKFSQDDGFEPDEDLEEDE